MPKWNNIKAKERARAEPIGTVKLSSTSKEKSSTNAPAKAPNSATCQLSKRTKAVRNATKKKAMVPSKDFPNIFNRPKFFPPNSAAASPKERKNMAVIATFREKKKITREKARQRKVEPLNLFVSVLRTNSANRPINHELNR